MALKPFATYAVRFHGDRIARLEEHWKHHRPLCVNGVVCVDSKDYTESLASKIKSLGLEVCSGNEVVDFDDNLDILGREAAKLSGGWFLTIDSDEFIPPCEFHNLALAARECDAYGAKWVHGWLCDRLAVGGLIPDEAPFAYADLSQAFPVMADVTAKIQGSCNVKCILSKKPNIGRHHYSVGNPHPAWIRVDHFKWFGSIQDDLRKRESMVWGSEYKRTLAHLENHGGIQATKCLSTIWEHVPGWFDFWNLYNDILSSAPKGRKLKFVEVGVWQGASAIYLVQYALALGLEFHLWLVDVFRGCEATGAHLPGLSAAYSSTSSFVSSTAYNLARNGASDFTSIIQSPSVVGSRIFDDGSCDLVFIDAEHSYQAVVADLSAWFPKIQPGGIIAGHDYDHSPVKKAVDEFGAANRLEVTVHGKCWLIRT